MKIFLNIKKSSVFKIAFFIWFLSEMTLRTTIFDNHYELKNYINYSQNIVILFLLLFNIIIYVRFNVLELFFIVLISIPIGISGILAKDFSLFSGWLFIINMKNENFEDIVIMVYYTLLFTIPVIIVLSLMGFIDNYTLMRGSRIRYSLGFSGPNQLGIALFQLMGCMLYVHRKNIRVFHYLILLFTAFFVAVVPNSQANVVCIIAMFLLVILYHFLQNHFMITVLNIMKRLMVFGLLAVNIYSVVYTILGINPSEHPFQYAADIFLSGRIILSNRIYRMCGITILGQEVNIDYLSRISSKLQFLDNAYAALIVRFGIICYILFSVGYICAAIYSKDKDDILFLLIFVYGLESFMTATFLSVVRNVFLLTISFLIYNPNKRVIIAQNS